MRLLDDFPALPLRTRILIGAGVFVGLAFILGTVIILVSEAVNP